MLSESPIHFVWRNQEMQLLSRNNLRCGYSFAQIFYIWLHFHQTYRDFNLVIYASTTFFIYAYVYLGELSILLLDTLL